MVAQSKSECGKYLSKSVSKKGEHKDAKWSKHSTESFNAVSEVTNFENNLRSALTDKNRSFDRPWTYLSNTTSLDVVQKKRKAVEQEFPGLFPSLDRKG